MALTPIEQFFQKVALGENLEELDNAVNCKDQVQQRTPLHMACGGANMKIVKALILLGAEIDAKDVGGETPLHTASNIGRPDVVKYLIA